MSKPARILVVDDQPEMVSIVAEVLEAEGYEVASATSGTEALALVQRLRPDLVLLDVVLGDANGVDLCRRIKSDPALAGVFVILISGVATRLDERVAGLDGGADEYLLKPFQPPELLARVSSLMRVQQVQKALQEAEERWHSLVQNAPEFIVTLDAEGRVEFANRVLPGHTWEQVIGSSIFEFCAPSGHAELRQLLDRVFQRGEAGSFELPGLRPDGTVAWFAGRAGPIKRNGRIESVVILATDETARKQAEAALQGAHDALEERVRERTAELARTNEALRREIVERKQAEAVLQEMPQRIIAAQESERYRVARELQDNVSQVLSLAKMRLYGMEAEVAQQSPSQRQTVARARELLEKAAQEIRRIAQNLRPRELDDLGLPTALRNFCDQFQESTGVEVGFHVGRMPRELSGERALCLYRVAQEALDNVAQHARASRVGFHLAKREAMIELRIADDGVGFADPAIESALTRRCGYGLTTMRERVVLLGGTFLVESAPGRGTEIIAQVPLRGAGRAV